MVAPLDNVRAQLRPREAVVTEPGREKPLREQELEARHPRILAGPLVGRASNESIILVKDCLPNVTHELQPLDVLPFRFRSFQPKHGFST